MTTKAVARSEARAIVSGGRFRVTDPPYAEAKVRCRRCAAWVHVIAPYARTVTDGMLIEQLATHIHEGCTP